MVLHSIKNIFRGGTFKISPEDQQVLRFDGGIQRPEDLATSTINNRKNGSVSVEDNAEGTKAWQEPTVAVNPDDDAIFAHIDGFFVADTLSFLLKITDMGFELPANSIIKGLVVEVRKEADIAGSAADSQIKLIKNGATVAENKANTDDWGTSFSDVSYGGATDLWGTTWTATEINSTSTGVLIQLLKEGTNADLHISGARITVYYTIPV